MKSESGKKRILVIEDEPVLGILCKRVLMGSGFEVDVVNNGMEAKKVAEEKDYDVCVSDIRLPGMTGIELFRHWQETSNPIIEKLVFITGDTMNNYVRDFLSEINRPSVMKPFEPEDLLATVRQVLSETA